MSARALAAPLLAVVLVAAPRLATACAVCMSGREDDVQFAFIASTAMMSVLPLLVIGGAVWWLRRRLREMEVEAAARASRALPAGSSE